MKNDLKERYIYAVTRHLPIKMQADVAKELDGLITEMLETRQANRMPGEDDIKAVLSELGAPDELALKYYGDKQTALISGTYFLMYKHILRIVLPIVASVVAAASILTFILGTGDSLNITILFVNITSGAGIIGNIFGATIQAFAIITIVFIIMDYRKTKLSDDGNMLANLPEVPEAKAKIHPAESIFGIIMSIVVLVVLLGYPHIIGVWVNGGWISVFNTEVLRGLWLPIVLWTVFGIAAESVSLIEGRYTFKLAAVTIIANLVIAFCAIGIFSGSNIVNLEFVSFIEGILQKDVQWLSDGLTHIHLVVLGIILISLVIEAISVIVKAFLARR